jgi:hypothetical protein
VLPEGYILNNTLFLGTMNIEEAGTRMYRGALIYSSPP